MKAGLAKDYVDDLSKRCDMAGIIKKTLYDGPCDGEIIEIQEDNLKIKPKVNVTNRRSGMNVNAKFLSGAISS